MRDSFIARLCLLAEKDLRLMLVSGDLGFKVFDQFRERFPDRFINVGVAEQNMIGVATGLALEGRSVFVYSIGNFPTLRCLEQIRNDVCYHKANVKIVSVGSGFSYGVLGASHHATEDISVMRCLPDMCIVAPGDVWESSEATEALYRQAGPAYLRLDRSASALLPRAKGEGFVIGEPRILREGKQVVLVSSGGISSEVLKAAQLLQADGVSCCVVHVHSIKPFKSARLLNIIRNCALLMSVEEHSVQGGLGGMLAEELMEAGAQPASFFRLGLRDEFAEIVGDQDYLRQRYGLDSLSIHARVLQMLGLKSTEVLKRALP